MKLETSQDYDVDNRYEETDGPNGSSVSDNNSGKKFLTRYINNSKDLIKQNAASDGQDEGRFIMSGPGDVTYGFRNAFRASLFNR